MGVIFSIKLHKSRLKPIVTTVHSRPLHPVIRLFVITVFNRCTVDFSPHLNQIWWCGENWLKVVEKAKKKKTNWQFLVYFLECLLVITCINIIFLVCACRRWKVTEEKKGDKMTRPTHRLTKAATARGPSRSRLTSRTAAAATISTRRKHRRISGLMLLRRTMPNTTSLPQLSSKRWRGRRWTIRLTTRTRSGAGSRRWRTTWSSSSRGRSLSGPSLLLAWVRPLNWWVTFFYYRRFQTLFKSKQQRSQRLNRWKIIIMFGLCHCFENVNNHQFGLIVWLDQCLIPFAYPPITYSWTLPLILDHSYLVGKLTSSKIADTKMSGF